MKDPANHEDMRISEIVEDFFKTLKIENQYYSVQLKQPVFLVGEKNLYEAIKGALENNK